VAPAAVFVVATRELSVSLPNHHIASLPVLTVVNLPALELPAAVPNKLVLIPADTAAAGCPDIKDSSVIP
jgi:hypothetical protein